MNQKFGKNQNNNNARKAKGGRVEKNTKFQSGSANTTTTSGVGGQSKKRQLLIKCDGAKWYRLRLTQNVPPVKPETAEKLGYEEISQLRGEALSLLKSDCLLYEELKSNSSKRDDFEWIRTVLQSGTVSDKLAAHTVLIQDSTVHNLRSIDNLIRFINPKGKRECVMALDNLRDLFLGDLLVPKETLKSFEELVGAVDRDFLFNDPYNVTRRQFLIMAHVEDQIRGYYKKFLDQLVTVSHDQLEVLKSKSIRTMYDLFVHNPEQEKYLLSSLINKLGDPTPKVASNAARLLSQVITTHHPTMKSVVAKEVERLLYRPHITERAQYYCLCFLSQMVFTPTVDQELANHLIEVYFTVFAKCTKLGEVNNKTMSVLLTGISRAFPYSKLETSFIVSHLDTFYRLIHYVSLNTAIQTIALVFNMVNFNESGSLTDRFYSALYRFVVDPRLDKCSKLNLLLNVIYRAVKKDPVVKRVRAFVKRLFQVASFSSSSPYVISILILVAEVLKTKEGFHIEANVLLKHSIQGDDEKTDKTGNETVQINSAFADDDDDDDEEEVYDDVTEEDGEEIIKNKVERKSTKTSVAQSWVFVKADQKETSDSNVDSDGGYKPNARNPLFAGAEGEECWELLLLRNHFHPTAKMFAEKILAGESVEYDGDPLEDFTIKKFLDRFVFRNPKKIDPDVSTSGSVFSRAKGSQRLNIQSTEYLKQSEDSVPIDEQFIFRYLQQKKSMQKKNYGEDDGDDSDIESVTSNEFNDLLDNYERYAEDFGDVDYAQDVKENRKTKKSKKIDEDEDADFDEEFDDDDFDMDDFDEDEIDDDNDDEDPDFGEDDDEDDFDGFDFDERDDMVKVKKPRNAAPFAGKKGFSAITNDIFASAEEFDHILDQNDTDSDFDEIAHEGGGNADESRSKKSTSNKRKRRPNLGRNLKAKKRRKDKLKTEAKLL